MLKNPEFFPQFTKEDKAAVQAVLDRGDLMSGREVAAFEEELAAYFGKRYAVCVSSGTAALECAFYWDGTRRGLRAGDKYGLHRHNFIAAKSAAWGAGFVPVPDPEGMPCPVLGQWENGDKIPDLPVVDLAHAFHITHWSRGVVHCYSFAPNKVIGCCGGVITTDDGVAAATFKQYRNHGRDGADAFMQGRNLRMGETNAALGRSQLKRINETLEKRFAVGRHYVRALNKHGREDTYSFLWPVQCQHHEHGFRSMRDFNIWGCESYEEACTALLPIYPHMTRADVEAVVACLRERKCL